MNDRTPSSIRSTSCTTLYQPSHPQTVRPWTYRIEACERLAPVCIGERGQTLEGPRVVVRPAEVGPVSGVRRVRLLFFRGCGGERGVVCARGECRLPDGGGWALPIACELS
jgi:hypothetical protein